MILDNLRVHHAKIVKEWLIGRENEIELFYLPSYFPELNPVEYLNLDFFGRWAFAEFTDMYRLEGEFAHSLERIRS